MAWLRRAPNWKTIGLTLDSKFRIMDRKSMWMAEYIHARRTGDRRKAFYRREHFAEVRPARLSHTEGER